jgi:hypothetical protein
MDIVYLCTIPQCGICAVGVLLVNWLFGVRERSPRALFGRGAFGSSDTGYRPSSRTSGECCIHVTNRSHFRGRTASFRRAPDVHLDCDDATSAGPSRRRPFSIVGGSSACHEPGTTRATDGRRSRSREHPVVKLVPDGEPISRFVPRTSRSHGEL